MVADIIKGLVGDKIAATLEVTDEKVHSIVTGKKKQAQYLTVVAVGPGILLQDGTRVPTAAKVGDKIVPNLHPMQVTINGQDLYLLNDRDIALILTEDVPAFYYQEIQLPTEEELENHKKKFEALSDIELITKPWDGDDDNEKPLIITP